MTNQDSPPVTAAAGHPYAPAPDTVLADTYEVEAVVVYPEDLGAINLTIHGRRNDPEGGGEPVTVHLTFEPEAALALSRDLRQGFLRVPLEKRHVRGR